MTPDDDDRLPGDGAWSHWTARFGVVYVALLVLLGWWLFRYVHVMPWRVS